MVMYSHSRLSTFEQCPLKFRYRYIEMIPPEFEQSIEGFLGNKVHDTLEWIYNHPSKDSLVLDRVIEHFIENWNRDFKPGIKIVKQDFTAEHYFNKGVKFLINYFMKHSPFEDNTIATEKRIFINLDSEGKYKLQGYIDRLVHHKDSNVFEIHDYKTSASMKSQRELDNDRQLALYALGVRQSYNEARDVHLFWHFLDFNEQKFSKRSLEQLEELKKELIQLIDKIESATEFPAVQSALCGWCEFRSHCPVIQEEILSKELGGYNGN